MQERRKCECYDEEKRGILLRSVMKGDFGRKKMEEGREKTLVKE